MESRDLQDGSGPALPPQTVLLLSENDLITLATMFREAVVGVTTGIKSPDDDATV